MPTGYTDGIIKGDITTFEEFAILCTRAFGATIHMRDQPLDKRYEKAEISEYHPQELDRLRKEKSEMNGLSDEEIIDEAKNWVEEEKRGLHELIQESHKSKIKLTEILNKAKKFEPPTKDHEHFKKFMIDQLEKTIDFDCGTEYEEDLLKKLDQIEMDAESLRKKKLDRIDKSISYHEEELLKEKERCEGRNKWMDSLFDSLKSFE